MHSSRLLNPLNCSPARPPHRQSLFCSLSTETLPELTRLLSGQSGAPESCIHQLLAGWAKKCTSWAALDITTQGPLAPALLPVQKGPYCSSITAAAERLYHPPCEAPNCHHAKCCLEILTTRRATTIPRLPMHPKMLESKQ